MNSDPWPYIKEETLKEYHSLKTPTDLDPLMDRVGESGYVLLGEASHGTHEFYTWRTAITKRLIREKNFRFIAVEGDWPDCFLINRYVKGHSKEKNAIDVLAKFRRWPTWMWANWEIAGLMEWLKEYNRTLPGREKIGFYGLDVYSLWESLEAIINYLREEDPHTARLAHHALNCFEPYEQGQEYAEAVRHVAASCSEEVVHLLSEIRNNARNYDTDPEASLNASINALVAANAEKYYRSLTLFDEQSWNIRDSHMFSTLEELMQFHGTDAKCIVWEHNTHVGDARATDMADSGLWNIGQLVREQHSGDGVTIVGFSSFQGSVIAGRFWGAEMEEMEVPPAKKGSVEEILHRYSAENKLILFDDHPLLKELFSTWYGHRAIGVVFRPEFERRNYVPTFLPKRYDALIYLDSTQGLYPLHIKPHGLMMPETYPFGV